MHLAASSSRHSPAGFAHCAAAVHQHVADPVPLALQHNDEAAPAQEVGVVDAEIPPEVSPLCPLPLNGRPPSL